MASATSTGRATVGIFYSRPGAESRARIGWSRTRAFVRVFGRTGDFTDPFTEWQGSRVPKQGRVLFLGGLRSTLFYVLDFETPHTAADEP